MGPIGTTEAVSILLALVNDIFPPDNELHIEQNKAQARTILTENLRQGIIKAHYLYQNKSIKINSQYWTSKYAERSILTSEYLPFIDDTRLSIGRAIACQITVDHGEIENVVFSMSFPNIKNAQVSGGRQVVASSASLSSSLPRGANSVSGGRPPKYDWEEVMFRILLIVHEKGLPKSKGQFLELVATELGNEAPGDTELKKRTSRVFDEISIPGSVRRKPIIV